LHSQRDPLWASEGLGLALKSEPSRLVEINEGGGPGVEVWNGGGCAGTMEEDERSSP
jgi:hypothetical protein